MKKILGGDGSTQEGYKSGMDRRRWLASVGMLFAGSRLRASVASPAEAQQQHKGQPLQLADFEPRSMLHVVETKVSRSRYPVIDVHTHLSFKAKQVKGVGIGEEMSYFAPVDAILPLMDRKNIRVMVDLTGGVGQGLVATIDKFQKPLMSLTPSPCCRTCRRYRGPRAAGA